LFIKKTNPEKKTLTKIKVMKMKNPSPFQHDGLNLVKGIVPEAANVGQNLLLKFWRPPMTQLVKKTAQL
jgi:hypothetical protein